MLWDISSRINPASGRFWFRNANCSVMWVGSVSCLMVVLFYIGAGAVRSSGDGSERKRCAQFRVSHGANEV